MKNFIIISFLLVFVVGASFDRPLNLSKTVHINKVENTSNIPVVDYDKIKRAALNFKFFPLTFYVSKDGCNTIADKFNTDSDLNIDICIGFNVIDDFHYLKVELLTPDNSVYQSLNIFVDRLDSEFRRIKYKNDYTLYPIVKPKIYKEISMVKGNIPLAGSVIQTQNLTGKWQINLYIDESKIPYSTLEFKVE